MSETRISNAEVAPEAFTMTMFVLVVSRVEERSWVELVADSVDADDVFDVIAVALVVVVVVEVTCSGVPDAVVSVDEVEGKAVMVEAVVDSTDD
jgi:hypothetical protein